MWWIDHHHHDDGSTIVLGQIAMDVGKNAGGIHVGIGKCLRITSNLGGSALIVSSCTIACLLVFCVLSHSCRHGVMP